MARTDIPVQEPPGKYPSLPLAGDAADFTWTAGDVVNNNSFKSTGREVVLVRNDDVAAQTLSVLSAADEKKRKGDITSYSVGASEYAMFGPFPVEGWRQTDGTIHIDPGDADLKFAAIKLPSL